MGILSNKDNLALWVKERDAVTQKFDVAAFREFYAKWHRRGVYAVPPEDLPGDDVLEIAIRKMVIHETNADPEKIKEATEWLVSRGYDLEIK